MDNAIALRIISIKDDPEQLNNFIDEYRPFVASCVQKSIGRYVEYGRDDELSIGLIAFHEAIKSYDQDKGHFLAFSSHVIRRRLVDYYRKQKKYTQEVSIEVSSADEDETYSLSLQKSIEEYNRLELERARRLELEQLKEELNQWKINFFDVAQASPKQEGTRKLYRKIINHIVNNKGILETLMTKKYLPIAKVCEQTSINRKKVERGRNYIIAGALIMSGQYEYIRDFIGGD
ncbi:MAG: RNA polymerase sigma-I factor [Clostridia bacterium]